MGPIEIILSVVVALATLGLGFSLGIFYRKKIAEAKIGTAEAQARIIMEEAKKEPCSKQKKKF